LPFSDPYYYLSSIYESIVAVEGFIEGMIFEEFCADEKTVAAVERKLSVISEAAVRLGEEGPRLCPDIPWRNVRGIGNWLRHQYDRVDRETIWTTVERDLPAMKAFVFQALERERRKAQPPASAAPE
jgi:uncharacterized protein with HEPN domain